MKKILGYVVLVDDEVHADFAEVYPSVEKAKTAIKYEADNFDPDEVVTIHPVGAAVVEAIVGLQFVEKGKKR